MSPDNLNYSSENGVLFNKNKTILIQGKNGTYTIPNSVTSIGLLAFYGCSKLTSIVIPDSVTSVGDAAFDHCSGLTSVAIPNSVVSIGIGTFQRCSSLTSVMIGSGVTSIENYDFSFCSSLTSVVIPDNVTSIGFSAFYSCSGLTSVTIGSGVTSIGDKAFYTSITEAYFYGNAPSIGNDVFYSSTVTVYFIEGAKGFTLPTWGGYHSATFIPADALTVTFTAGNGGLINPSGTTQTIIQILVPCKDCKPVTATPIGGYYFVKWTGSGGFTSTENPLTVKNVTTDMNIIANFAPIVPQNYSLIFSVNPTSSGTTTPSGTITVSSGVSQNITATATSGYKFVKWTAFPALNANIADVNCAETSIMLTGDCVLSATFAVDTGDYSISGTVSGDVTQGVTLTLSGAGYSTTTSGGDGTFQLAKLANGSYTVTPSLSGYTFTPLSRNIIVSGGSVSGCDFVATKNPGIYSISGTISGGVQEGVTITLSGALSSTALSDAYGTYNFTGLANGDYTVTPEQSGYIFTPFSQDVTIAGANQTGVLFTEAAISIFGTISKPSFTASHKDSVKKIDGAYSQYSTDKFTIQATVQFPDGFDLATIGKDTGFTFNFGFYSFSGTLGNDPKAKLNKEKGGSASFKIVGNDEIKGKMVTVEKVDLRWDKKKKVTVKVTGSPALNTATNVVDLSGKADGPVTGTIDTFVLTFNNAGARFAEGESLPYTGKKTTKTVIKDKGKATEKTFTLVEWSGKGKK